MGLTMMERAFKRAVDDLLEQPDWVAILVKYRNAMRKRLYPQWELDFVTQRWIGDYDFYDAYGFMIFHAMLGTGEIGGFRLYVGSEPLGDHCGQEMNHSLKRIHENFRAEFQGGVGTWDNDGHIDWYDAPILSIYNSPESDVIYASSLLNRVPLEVGYTAIWTTFYHLQWERGLARWMYGYDDIYVYISTGTRQILDLDAFSRAFLDDSPYQVRDLTQEGLVVIQNSTGLAFNPEAAIYGDMAKPADQFLSEMEQRNGNAFKSLEAAIRESQP